MARQLVSAHSAFGRTPVYRDGAGTLTVVWAGREYVKGRDDAALRTAILAGWQPADAAGQAVYRRLAAGASPWVCR